jgi:hypothetical protein
MGRLLLALITCTVGLASAGCMCTASWMSTYPIEYGELWSQPEEVLISREGAVAVKFRNAEHGGKVRFLVVSADGFSSIALRRLQEVPDRVRDEACPISIGTDDLVAGKWAMVPSDKSAPDASLEALGWKNDAILAVYRQRVDGTGSAASTLLHGPGIVFPYDLYGHERRFQLRTNYGHANAAASTCLMFVPCILADIVTFPIQVVYLAYSLITNG